MKEDFHWSSFMKLTMKSQSQKRKLKQSLFAEKKPNKLRMKESKTSQLYSFLLTLVKRACFVPTLHSGLACHFLTSISVWLITILDLTFDNLISIPLSPHPKPTPADDLCMALFKAIICQWPSKESRDFHLHYRKSSGHSLFYSVLALSARHWSSVQTWHLWLTPSALCCTYLVVVEQQSFTGTLSSSVWLPPPCSHSATHPSQLPVCLTLSSNSLHFVCIFRPPASQKTN